MSKLVLQSDAYGAGVVLLRTANISTDIDLELPSQSGKLALVNGSGGSTGDLIVDGILPKFDSERERNGVCRFASDATAATSPVRNITINGFPEGSIIAAGTRITVRFKNGINCATQASLKINGVELENSGIYFRNSALKFCPKGSILDLVYDTDSTGWHVVDQGLVLDQITQGAMAIQEVV